MKIVNTDNYNGDYPDEEFINLPNMTKEHAKMVCEAINGGFNPGCSRWWKVVDNDYELHPGFEP